MNIGTLRQLIATLPDDALVYVPDERTIRIAGAKLVVPENARFVLECGVWCWITDSRGYSSLSYLRNNEPLAWRSCCDRARCAWLDEVKRQKDEGGRMFAEDNAEAWRRAGEKWGRNDENAATTCQAARSG